MPWAEPRSSRYTAPLRWWSTAAWRREADGWSNTKSHSASLPARNAGLAPMDSASTKSAPRQTRRRAEQGCGGRTHQLGRTKPISDGPPTLGGGAGAGTGAGAGLGAVAGALARPPNICDGSQLWFERSWLSRSGEPVRHPWRLDIRVCVGSVRGRTTRGEVVITAPERDPDQRNPRKPEGRLQRRRLSRALWRASLAPVAFCERQVCPLPIRPCAGRLSGAPSCRAASPPGR